MKSNKGYLYRQEVFYTDTYKNVENIVNILTKKGLTLSAAESCTGGMVSSAIVDYPGASNVFIDGIVSYANEAKMKFLGVKSDTLEKYSAVSPQTAEEMCRGVALRSNTDIGISTTGYAGPVGGTKEDPVGTVYIGIYIKGKVYTERLSLSGTRTEVRQRATEILLERLVNKITAL